MYLLVWVVDHTEELHTTIKIRNIAYKILNILKLKTKVEYTSKLFLFKLLWDPVPYAKVRRLLSLQTF